MPAVVPIEPAAEGTPPDNTVGTPARSASRLIEDHVVYSGSQDNQLRGPRRRPSGAKKSATICSKLAKTFLFETMTPAGVRVILEVYNTRVSGVSLPVGRGPAWSCRESKSSKSAQRLIVRTGLAVAERTLDIVNGPDVVRMIWAWRSLSTKHAIVAPACGTGSGTAIRPARNAPRNPNDVFDFLRCQYHCPITGRPHMPERSATLSTADTTETRSGFPATRNQSCS